MKYSVLLHCTLTPVTEAAAYNFRMDENFHRYYTCLELLTNAREQMPSILFNSLLEIRKEYDIHAQILARVTVCVCVCV